MISEKLGEISYEDSEVITFPEGLLGFPEKQRFIVVDHRTDSPFKWLQCVDDPSLAFLIINPVVVKPDYHIEIGREDLALLENADPPEIAIWTLVSLPLNQPEQSSTNLLGPLAINHKTRLGKQLVLDPGRYDVHFPIFQRKG
jgi:flagellar assembly factor FliW